MRADDGTDVTDLDRPRVDRAQLREECIDVVALGVQHGEVGDVAVFFHLLNEERERLRPGALAAALFHLALADVDDRLDGERRGDHRLRTADTAALFQVLQRVECSVHVDTTRQRVALGFDLVETGTGLGSLGAGARDDALAHRDAAAVDDAHRDVVGDGPCGDLGALHRCRQRR